MSGFIPSGDTDDGSGWGAQDLIETLFLVGVGAASLTRDRLRALLDDLVARGRLSGEAARALLERIAARGQDRVGGSQGQIDVSDIDFRLRQIEHRLRLLESRTDRCTDDKDS